MAGTNAYCTFGYDQFGKFAVEEMPKGTCFSLGVNPFNGLVVLKYNRSAASMVVIDDLLAQIAHKVGQVGEELGRDAGMLDFIDVCDGRLQLGRFEPCPFCGDEPVYESYGDTDEYPGNIVCCGGKTHIEGFGSRLEAVRFWNDRSRRVA